jgi:hypothetical protein
VTTAVRDARNDLNAALRTVPDLRVHDSPSGLDSPPAAFLTLPVLVWESSSPLPTDAHFGVIVCVSFDDRGVELLETLVPAVVAAIESVDDAVVTSAVPNKFDAGTQEMLCYQIQVEVSLS